MSEKRHEPDPLRFGWLVAFVFGLIVLGWGTKVLVWRILVHYTQGVRAVDRPRSAARVDAGGLPPGAPALQPIPQHDLVPWQELAAMRESEDRVFAGMGWPVKEGRAQIPDAVVKAVAARPTTQATTQPARSGGGGS